MDIHLSCQWCGDSEILVDAGMVVDDSNIDFTIRWCKKATEIDSTHFRVEFNGEICNIAAIDHMNYRRKSIKLSYEK